MANHNQSDLVSSMSVFASIEQLQADLAAAQAARAEAERRGDTYRNRALVLVEQVRIWRLGANVAWSNYESVREFEAAERARAERAEAQSEQRKRDIDYLLEQQSALLRNREAQLARAETYQRRARALVEQARIWRLGANVAWSNYESVREFEAAERARAEAARKWAAAWKERAKYWRDMSGAWGNEATSWQTLAAYQEKRANSEAEARKTAERQLAECRKALQTIATCTCLFELLGAAQNGMVEGPFGLEPCDCPGCVARAALAAPGAEGGAP